MRVEHKYTRYKKHDTHNRLVNHLGGFRKLPTMVCNVSKTQCANHPQRRQSTMENPQEKHQMQRPQMAPYSTQRRQNLWFRMRVRIQIHAKTTLNIQHA